MFDASELRQLAEDLGKIPGAAVPIVEQVVTEHGEELRAGWVANASATSGKHGKFYPKSITAEPKFGLGKIGVEVGPESGKKQGGMGRGFEYGSVNQPPHLDGNKAADVVEPKFADALPKAITDLLARSL